MYKNKRLKATKEIVIDIIREHPDWNATQVYERYKAIVDPKNWVTLNSIQKHLEGIKPQLNKMIQQGLDRPWNIGITEENNITPDIIPVLIECEQIEECKLTIRQAKWFMRLKPAVYEMVKKAYPDSSPLGILSLIAFEYSRKEQISELKDEKLDTTNLDNIVFINPSEDSLANGLMSLFDDMESNKKDGE